MDIDLSVLRSLESEKDISSETAIKAIEDALLMAYHKTEGANPAARVEVDRKTGHVTVWAKEAGPDGTPEIRTAITIQNGQMFRGLAKLDRLFAPSANGLSLSVNMTISNVRSGRYSRHRSYRPALQGPSVYRLNQHIGKSERR